MRTGDRRPTRPAITAAVSACPERRGHGIPRRAAMGGWRCWCACEPTTAGRSNRRRRPMLTIHHDTSASVLLPVAMTVTVTVTVIAWRCETVDGPPRRPVRCAQELAVAPACGDRTNASARSGRCDRAVSHAKPVHYWTFGWSTSRPSVMTMVWSRRLIDAPSVMAAVRAKPSGSSRRNTPNRRFCATCGCATTIGVGL